jgi:cellulose synthase (UDP-forming)
MIDDPSRAETGRLITRPQRIAILLLFSIMVYTGTLPMVNENQLLLSAGLIVALMVFSHAEKALGDFSRLAVIFLGAYLSLRYWLFRTTATISFTGIWDHLFLIALYLAETYGIFTHLLGLFVNLAPVRRQSPPLPPDPRDWPTVDVFVPTYNEPVDMVAVTLTACSQLDYPKEKLNVYVLDDGGTTQKLSDPDPAKAAAARERAARLRSTATSLGIHYLNRALNVHAKAGNINAALGAAVPGAGGRRSAPSHNPGLGEPRPSGDLILVLDCDHVPTKDFLQQTVGFFVVDEKLAVVQTPHFFINPTPVEKNLDTFRQSPGENEMFYGGIQMGLDFWNASFFCGSAALLRRRYLMEIGGFVEDTITEDAGTALMLHSKGLNSVYLNKPMTMGLSPESFDGFIIQRSRWAKGMVQILLLRNPLLQRGLSTAQRICYLNACLFWLFGFARLIFFLSPLLFLLFGLRVYNASLMQVLVYAVPHLVASYFVSNFLYGKLRHPFYSELFEIIQSIYLIPAVLSVFLHPKTPRFQVTPKSVSLERDRLTHLATPFYVMFLLNLAGFAAGAILLVNQPTLLDTVTICLCWNTFNLLLVICCIGVVWERRQLRLAHRYTTSEPVTLLPAGSTEALAARMIDLSTTGVGLMLENATASDAFVLGASDSYGNTYELPARVLRVQNRPGRVMLGCHFEAGSPEVLRRIIGFVYGDSGRWKYFADARHTGGVSSLRALYRLVRIGLKGSWRNAAGLLHGAVRSGRPAGAR